MPNPQEFADMVVLTIKAALGPRDERLAVLEQKVRDLEARLALEKRCAGRETRMLLLLASVRLLCALLGPQREATTVH